MQIMDCIQLELDTNNFWGYKVEEKLHVGVREQKGLSTTDLGEVRSQEGTTASSGH
jgi:hypothetical protein